MLRERVRKRGGEVAGSAGVFRKIGGVNSTLYIPAEIRPSGVLQGDIRAFVNAFAFLKLHFRAVEDTRNAAVGEHQAQVLRPYVLRFGETVELHLIRGVVMRVHIHHVPRRIVVVLVVRRVGDIPCLRGAGEVPVHGEVDHVQSGGLGIVRRMVVIAVQECILRGRLTG